MLDRNTWDYLRIYIDTKINKASTYLKELFDTYRLKEVSDNITNVNTVAELKDQINVIADIPDSVSVVGNDIESVTTTADSINDIKINANNITDITAVSNNINNVNITANSIDNVNTYSKTYQGAKELDPTTRNDGTELLKGDLYFNTDVNKMKVFDGDAWQLTGSVINSILKTQSWVGDGTTTEFEVDGGYNDNFAEIYLNGSNVTKDVDISNGVSIKFDEAPTDDSNIYGVFFGSFQLADTYTRTEIDKKSVSVDMVHIDSDSDIAIGKKYFIDTSSGSITLTLPYKANDGEQILIYDSAKTFNDNNCIVHSDNDDNTINLSNNDLNLDITQVYYIIYNSDKSNWEVY